MIALGVIAALGAIGWLALHRRARFERLPAPQRGVERRDDGTVRGVSFAAIDGTRIDAWLFLPHAERPPVVVMASGLGGTKDGFLERYAWRFAERGIASLVFDYRCFGGSDGTPRHWVDPARHAEDYQAAIAFVRGELGKRGDVDGTRVALWGSSFSGGTAITLAAKDRGIRALVAQCPYLQTPPALQPRGLSLARFVLWTTLDVLRVLPPIYVPLFGRPGEWAFATSHENPSVRDFGGPLGSRFWRELPKPGLGGWENRMLARVLASIDAFVPLESVASITCPTLFVAANDDDMVPLEYVEAAHARLPGSELLVAEGGHFDLYVGDSHAPSAGRQAAFLADHLLH